MQHLLYFGTEQLTTRCVSCVYIFRWKTCVTQCTSRALRVAMRFWIKNGLFCRKPENRINRQVFSLIKCFLITLKYHNNLKNCAFWPNILYMTLNQSREDGKTEIKLITFDWNVNVVSARRRHFLPRPPKYILILESVTKFWLALLYDHAFIYSAVNQPSQKKSHWSLVNKTIYIYGLSGNCSIKQSA